jgi:hypothetical protein
MKNDIKADLEQVDKHLIRVNELCDIYNITTLAGREFTRFSLANALLMERKQLDYGPHNIAKFGSTGCLMRMSDKMERLIHLMNVTGRKKKVINESITDSYRDFANYGIIALMVEEGKWPTT